MKQITIFFLIFFSFSCANAPNSSPTKQPDFPTDSYMRLETSIVELFEEGENSKPMGTCSSWSVANIDGNTIGVTNFHCVDTDPMLMKEVYQNKIKLKRKVRLTNDKTYEIRVLKVDKKNDLASFIVYGVKVKPIPLMDSRKQLKKGTKVYTIGSPAGFVSFKDNHASVPIIEGLYWGKVRKANDKIFNLYTMRVFFGSSGSVVITEIDGEFKVCGIINSFYNVGNIFATYNDISAGPSFRALDSFVSEYLLLSN